MGSILLVAEIQKGKVREASLELVAFARKIGATYAADAVSAARAAARLVRVGKEATL